MYVSRDILEILSDNWLASSCELVYTIALLTMYFDTDSFQLFLTEYSLI